MRVAIDLPARYQPAWVIAAGAHEAAVNRSTEAVILLPNAPGARAEDADPANWDGVIVHEPRPELNLPQVCISSVYRDDMVSATIDSNEIVKLIIDQFVSMGITNLAYFSYPDRPISEIRWNCFRRQVKNLQCSPVFVDASQPNETLSQIRKPCGIMAFNDYAGLRLLRRCKRLGLRVPGDVHVISVDNSPLCFKETPTLSSIAMPFPLIGYHATHLCERLIRGESPNSILVPPSGLVLRDSVKVEHDDIKTATEIAHYLRSSLSHPIQMEDVVRRSSMSRRRLEQIFRSAYGSSPMAYLKTLRLDHAKKILASGDAPLKDIAKECGLTDSNYLCQVFRERVGMTPLQYRNSAEVER